MATATRTLSPRSKPNGCLTPHRGGFTIIELLVVVAVIGVLMAILIPALGKARECAVITGELSASRQFITAHQMYSNDNSGRVMVGYASRDMVQRGEVVAKNQLGTKLAEPYANRYPWRLLPYMDYAIGFNYRDSKIINGFPEELRDYPVSLAPRFGLNQAFVGGSGDADVTGKAFAASPTIRGRVQRAWGERWYVSRVSQVKHTTHLMVFASSAFPQNIPAGLAPVGVTLDGYYRVTPPRFDRPLWNLTVAPNESTAPENYGNVSFRFSGRTVASMFDGHSETLTWTELKDMRRWAPGATGEDWQLPPL